MQSASRSGNDSGVIGNADSRCVGANALVTRCLAIHVYVISFGQRLEVVTVQSRYLSTPLRVGVIDPDKTLTGGKSGRALCVPIDSHTHSFSVQSPGRCIVSCIVALLVILGYV